MVYSSLTFFAIFVKWEENHALNEDVFLPNFHVCSLFSANCSSFAIECDWNRKISQNVENSFFEKLEGLFENKLDFSFKIANGGKFDAECASNGYISGKCFFRFNDGIFSQKNQ